MFFDIVQNEYIDDNLYNSSFYKIRLYNNLIKRYQSVLFKGKNIYVSGYLNSYKKDELLGVSVVYRDKERGTSKIKSFVDIEDFPAMLASGGLGNAMIDDSLLKSLKKTNEKKDYSWLGV